ncbi:MAG TPA: hypothetical protein VKE22_24410 [Haliangiales bacterium]|nr:hypothetical protein [Haliangiales bacterium]
MRALVSFFVLCSCGSTAPAPPPPAASPPGDLVDGLLARLDRAAGCDRGASPWCLATRGWATGTVPAIPDGVLAGITIGLERDRPDAELPRGLVTFSAFAAGGGKVFVTDIPPVNAAEQKTLDAAAASVADALVGRAPRAELPRSLLDLLKTLPKKYPVARAAGEWRYAGEADGRIRRVGDVWVVIEIPRSGPAGIILSIYTDKVAVKNLPR